MSLPDHKTQTLDSMMRFELCSSMFDKRQKAQNSMAQRYNSSSSVHTFNIASLLHITTPPQTLVSLTLSGSPPPAYRLQLPTKVENDHGRFFIATVHGAQHPLRAPSPARTPRRPHSPQRPRSQRGYLHDAPRPLHGACPRPPWRGTGRPEIALQRRPP